MAAVLGTVRTSAVEPRRDIKALTGLRAVAATLVVLFHAQFFVGPYTDFLPMIRPLIGAGWTGVELFFVLSGFVITYTYADRLARLTPGGVVQFVLARVARIWPAWAAVTLFMGAWVWVLRRQGMDADVIAKHPDADLPTLLSQLSMTHMWGHNSPIGNNYVFPGWSISAEWAAYLAFPLLLVLLRPLRRLPAVALMVLSVATMMPLSVEAFRFGTPDFEQAWPVRIACGFTAGMLAAMAIRRVRAGSVLERSAPTLLWGSILLFVAGTSWAAWRRAADMTFDYAGIVAVLFPVLVVSLALTEQGPARWLARPAMVYVGRISYCLYLVHFVVLDVALTIWWQNPADVEILSPGLALAVPFLLILSFVLAAALHHGVEEPGRRLILRLTGSRAGRRRAGTGSVAPTTAAATTAAAATDAAVAAVVPPRSRVGVAAPAPVPAVMDSRTERLGLVYQRTAEESLDARPRVPAGAAPSRDLASR
ncbi:acyltransferase [Blastococcus sp. LR1]|uniref:acyltransferase family protein n=1 Tax=Blastococcus sp. LR1 TaxID=2877000 RepID=UPI001CCBA3F2|nr:acyltransferase [Blastococcus sp. LR1]MCA0146211.1 acyltransferase [Blastococcus sp. LR1]